jgi:hypothetical protein
MGIIVLLGSCASVQAEKQKQDAAQKAGTHRMPLCQTQRRAQVFGRGCNTNCNKTAGVCPQVLADGAARNSADASAVRDDYARCFLGTCQIPDPGTCG